MLQQGSTEYFSNTFGKKNLTQIWGIKNNFLYEVTTKMRIKEYRNKSWKRVELNKKIVPDREKMHARALKGSE